MNGSICCLVLTSLIFAGCAATPEQEVAEMTSIPALPPDSETGTADGREIARTVALTARELDTSSVITCRDIRTLGSNVLMTRCMTRAAWEQYERAQTIQAQELLRRIRGEH